MRDIILYYYDHSDEMEFLNDIQEKIARKNKTTETKVRDALNSYIRKIKTSSFSSYSTELNKILYRGKEHVICEEYYLCEMIDILIVDTYNENNIRKILEN